MHFVGNLILNTSCEFYHDDLTVTSFINIKYGDVAVELIPESSRNEQHASGIQKLVDRWEKCLNELGHVEK